MKTLIAAALLALVGCNSTPQSRAAARAVSDELDRQQATQTGVFTPYKPIPVRPMTPQPKPQTLEVCNAYTNKCTDVIVTPKR